MFAEEKINFTEEQMGYVESIVKSRPTSLRSLENGQ